MNDARPETTKTIGAGIVISIIEMIITSPAGRRVDG
jgi:hypothetical protein